MGPEYSHDLAENDKRRIAEAIFDGVASLGLHEARIWGPLLEDCSSQVTYSGLGQDAPLDRKKLWDPDGRKRRELCSCLRPRLPGFDVHAAGYTSVEVTPQGMDKGYAVERLLGTLGTHVTRTVYVADGFHIDGSDVPVALLGVPSIWVRSCGRPPGCSTC